jgi:Tol biopolymer transport system component
MAIDSLVQRGIPTSPAWRADGRLLAMTTEGGYSLDIMAFDLNNSTWQPLVNDGSHDFWPSFSPDSRYMAFVSDRETCPMWDPREAGACVEGLDPGPTGGHVYLLELESGEVTRLSDEPTFETPYWINNSELAFTTGDPLELLNPSRSLWLASASDGSAREIMPEGVSGAPFNLSEAWSPDGSEVIFQKADGSTTETVVMNADGEIIATLEDLSFSRFTLAASWSADGTRVAVGGGGGQCPYGVRVLDDNFQRVASGGIPPTMCDPIFSGNGQYIAFTGVNTARGDGRVDVYTVSPNGVDRVTLTLDLRGQMRLIGWVGPG